MTNTTTSHYASARGTMMINFGSTESPSWVEILDENDGYREIDESVSSVGMTAAQARIVEGRVMDAYGVKY